MAKSKISRDDYYRIVGLLRLAEEENKILKRIELSLANILDIKNDGHGYFGHVTDAVWSGDSADTLLENLEITVAEDGIISSSEGEDGTGI